ncbi:alpha-1-3-glucanase/mutanase [Penicillium chermesinum]|nr:alpha-1-3-glucanase/mutanase [Penicillium chermesinum]
MASPQARVQATASFPSLSEDPSGAGDRLVFCHFMIGICSNRQGSDEYDGDMQRAKDFGIDAFALNIGTDSYTDTQLGFAYDSAARNDMKIFLSFDFNWWSKDQAAAVGTKVKQYASHPAQLLVDGKVFVSSFAGDGIDVEAMTSAAGQDLFFAPNFHPGQGDFSAIQGALNWMAWPSDGNNRAPREGHNITVADGDMAYLKALNGKPYIAQSHYIGPLSSPHTDDGSSKWVMDMPHGGWLEMSKPFIAAYKAGTETVLDYIEDEKLVYWYRPTKRSLDCDATDTTMTGSSHHDSGNFFTGRPNGWETMADSVFVTALLKSPATVQVQSGDQAKTFQAPAGISAWTAPMGVGKQQFSVSREAQTVFSGSSLKDIVDFCVCGIYNFNAYVGTLPAPAFIDRLQPAGMALLGQGLKVECPMNTLGAP